MQTIEDVKNAISLNTELLSETKKRIEQTALKLSAARGNAENIQVEIKNLKERRQSALVKGGDVKGQSDALKKLEAQQELELETITGLETFLKELRAEEQELHFKIDAMPKRILQLRSLELAAAYNALAEQMAPIVAELNTIWHKVTGNGNRKEDMVAHFPKDKGPFVEIPRIFFDDAGLNLEAYVAKYPGRYHSNATLPSEEKNFYSWPIHENRLRNG